VTGNWGQGRIGIFRRGKRAGSQRLRRKAIGEKGEASIGAYDSYDVLLTEIVNMFRTGKVPVPPEETLELLRLHGSRR